MQAQVEKISPRRTEGAPEVGHAAAGIVQNRRRLVQGLLQANAALKPQPLPLRAGCDPREREVGKCDPRAP